MGFFRGVKRSYLHNLEIFNPDSKVRSFHKSEAMGRTMPERANHYFDRDLWLQNRYGYVALNIGYFIAVIRYLAYPSPPE